LYRRDSFWATGTRARTKLGRMQGVGKEAVLARSRAGALFPWLLTALVFASRLPYLRPGYGTDPDAYRVIAAARALRAGEYTASRLPGYPLHEALTALLLPGGPRLVNGGTALVSALAALALFRLAEQLGLDRLRATLLALAFAFTPVVFVNSTSSIDYLWSICFVLWSAVQLVSGRAWLAGILLGAAIGTRLTAGAMIVPLLVLNGSARFAALRLSLGAAASAALFFAPVLITYGFAFFQYDATQTVSWQRAVDRATLDVWGSPGVYAFLGVFAIAVCARKQIGRAFRRPGMRSLSSVVCSALLLFGAAFVILPLEAGYLIPCVPFLLLWLAFMLPALAIAELAGLLLLSCFVTVDANGCSAMGPVPSARVQRIEENALAGRIIRRLSATPGRALVVAGSMLPLIEVKLGGSQQGQHRYLYLLQSEAELLEYLKQGYALYYVSRSIERRQRRLGIALRAHGARSVL
jgi:hypothetical protein